MAFLKKAVLKLLSLLKVVAKGSKIIGRGFIIRLWAVTSRSRLAVAAVLYYIVYENLDVFLSLNPQRIVTAIGAALLEADTTVLTRTQHIVAGGVPPVPVSAPVVGQITAVPGEPFAAIAIIGALTTILLYFRAWAIIVQRMNPNIGIIGLYAAPLVVYGLAVFAVSALRGDPRFPFQGVITLVENVDAVFGNDALNTSVNASSDLTDVMQNATGNLSER